MTDSLSNPLSLCALAIAGLMAPNVALAQSMTEGSTEGASRSLETIQVNTRRSIAQRFFAPGSLVMVDRSDIEELGAFSISDVLRQLPGVQLTSRPDGGVEIRMRGMERNATQLLIDGQRVGSGRAQLALDQLPAELLERIEVVRAPSAEFAGATGGTLNLVLRQASVRRETNIRLTDNRVWGRDAGQAFFSRTGPLFSVPPAAADEAAPAASEHPWSYFIALNHSDLLLGSDVQHRSVSDHSLTADTQGQGRYRRTDMSLVPRISGRIGPSDQLGLRATLSHARFGGQFNTMASGQVGAIPYLSESSEVHRYQRQYAQGAVDWTHRFAHSKLETTLSVSQAGDTVDRSGDTVAHTLHAPYAFYDKRQDRTQSFSSKLTGTTGALLWSGGVLAERRELEVHNSRTGSGAVPTQFTVGVMTQRNAVWGQNEWELPGSSTLTAGLRYESLGIKGSDAAPLAQRTAHFVQPSLHLRTPLSEQMQWRANVTRITRNPSIWNLVDRSIPSQGSNSINNPDTLGNPWLKPEVALSLDTGVERRLALQGQVGLNLFVRQLHDALAPTRTLQGARWVEQQRNVGDATVWGLEADLKTDLGSDWTLSANASLLQSRMGEGLNPGQRIPGQARYLTSLTVTKPLRRTGGFFGGGTLTMTGPADLNSSPGITGRNAARATLDLYIGSVLPKLGYWRLGIFNISDARYRSERSYVDARGRVAQSDWVMSLTPRVYLSVGTQF